jgi:NAD(P)-dependent dehydrogenase (short-subunit alcohol dehydrogenase family)
MSKVVLITGASSGIGRAIAEKSAEAGHRVYGASRSLEPSDSEDLNFIPRTLDVTDDDSVEGLIHEIDEREGGIDVLVNCAGIGLTGALEETPIEEAKTVFDTNVFGTLRTIRTVLPRMRSKGKGTIINIGSIGGQVSLPFRGVYCSSKSALESLSRSLSMEVRPFGVDVFLIHPGDFSTNINRNRKVVNGTQDSAYKELSTEARKVIEKEVDDGSDPELIARLVLKILEGKRRNTHYRVGKWVQRLTPVLQFLLPDRVFERQLMRHYRIHQR